MFREAIPGDADQLRSGVQGDDLKSACRQAARCLTRAAANLENGVVISRVSGDGDIIEQSLRIVGTGGVIEDRDAIEREPLLHTAAPPKLIRLSVFS